MTTPDPRRFFAELKRRRVFRVMAVYGATAFVVIQAADVIFPAIPLPAWTVSLVVWLALLGFPIAIVLAWAFETTPEGVRRTAEPAPGELTQILAEPASKRWPAGLLALVGILAMLAGAWYVGRRTAPASVTDTTDGPALESIAVLPFADLSPAADQAYFSDGLSEELLAVLAQIPDLQVASRTSSFAFKGQALAPEEIARRLRVGKLVEGSVRRAGDRLRVTAQLIDAESGFELWSGNFDEEAGDWIEIQDRIARAIGSALELELAADLGIESRSTRDSRAHDLYLQGRFLWGKRSLDDLRQALALFEQAIALDSTYALAWSGLADTYVALPFYSHVATTEAFPNAREAAERALAISPDLFEARTTLAYLRALYDWDIVGSDREFREILNRNPRYATALKWHSDVLSVLGRPDEALESVRLAEKLDPASPNIQTILGMKYQIAGDYETALAYYDRALALDSGFPLTLKHASWIYWSRGDTARFLAARERLEDIGVPVEAPASEVRQDYQSGGAEAAMHRMAEGLGARGMPLERARWHALLGEEDAAFVDLEEAFDTRNVWTMFVTTVPELESLRGDPRYVELLGRMTLPGGGP